MSPNSFHLISTQLCCFNGAHYWKDALDEIEPEDIMHLVSWFFRMNSEKESLMKEIDQTLEITDETFESIFIVVELPGHCTAREPYQ